MATEEDRAELLRTRLERGVQDRDMKVLEELDEKNFGWV
jgi:hypothetical protein